MSEQAAAWITLAISVAGFGALPIVWRRRRELWESVETTSVKTTPVEMTSVETARVVPVVFLLLALAVMMAYAGGASVALQKTSPAWMRWCGFLTPLLFAAFVLRTARRVLPPPRVGPVVGSGRALLVLWAALPIVMGLFVTMQWIGYEQTQAELATMKERGDGWQWMAVLAVILAPVMEETAFRGLLYPGIRALLGRSAAIGITALLFGAIHLLPSVVPSMIVFGVAMALAREWTGSTLACIVAHIAFNGLNTALALTSS